MRRPDFRLLALAVFSCTLTWLIGCGGGGASYEVVPVSVTVTYEDGSPISVGQGEYVSVNFHPEAATADDAEGPRPGSGTLSGSGGKVEGITTYEQDDGLVLGKHKVTLTATTTDRSANPIPAPYGNPATTPLEIEVTESGQTFDLKVAKR
jgi:hypothetical protein